MSRLWWDKLLNKLRWWKYYYFEREKSKFIPWLARKLPTKLKYYVVIHGMCKVEPNLNPDYVTGMQLLEYFKYAK